MHSATSDIDTLCICARHCSREHFFDSVPDLLSRNHKVSEIHAVRDAYVPVMKMKFSGISIDLLFVSLNKSVIPAQLDLLNNR